MTYTKEQLIDFEKGVVDIFNDGQLRSPVHLSGGDVMGTFIILTIFIICLIQNPMGTILFSVVIGLLGWLFWWAPEWVQYTAVVLWLGAMACWGLYASLIGQFFVGMWEGYHRDDT